MSIFKNTTSMKEVGGDSMYFPMGKGDTSNWWSSHGFNGSNGKVEGRKVAKPHMAAKMTSKMRKKV
jgi:hypothetical protein